MLCILHQKELSDVNDVELKWFEFLKLLIRFKKTIHCQIIVNQANAVDIGI
jgi:hypothetical protein